MDKLIRRSDAIKAMADYLDLLGVARQYAKSVISKVPAVEPKQGKWKINNNGWAYCSECESLGLESYNFCPQCGAKMKGADDE